MSDDKPVLGRPLWKNRGIWVLTAFVAMLLIVRLAWGWWAARQLALEVERIRQRGEPLSVNDLVCRPVPDAENAWYYQTLAIQAIAPFSAPRYSNPEFEPYPPYPRAWLKLAAASEKANARVFVLARQARQHSAVQIHRELGPPLTRIYFSYAAGEYSLADTLRDGTMHAHVQGDDAEAVERLLDLLHLSRSVRHGLFMPAQVSASFMEGRIAATVLTLAPRIRFQPGAATRPAHRDQVIAAINQLLDERPALLGVQRSLAMERLVFDELVEEQDAWVVRPLLDLERVRLYQTPALVADAVATGSWPEAEVLLHRSPVTSADRPRVGRSRIPRYSRWFAVYLADPVRLVRQHFHAMAARRAAALSLACQLFRADQGRWPQDLNELVPAYLAGLPRDPLQKGNKPIGYAIFRGALPGGADRPMLVLGAAPDNGPLDVEPRYVVGERISGPLYLDVAQLTPTHSTEAVSDDPEEPDTPGDKAAENGEAE